MLDPEGNAMFAGVWTCRSFRNDTGLVDNDPVAALALILGEGVLELRDEDDTHFSGALGMADGHAFTLEGAIVPGSADGYVGFGMVATGMAGTPTAGRRYEYRGVTSFAWPHAVGQVPCLLGTVLRVNAHGPDAPAGTTASFIAARHPNDPQPRTARRNILAG